MLGEKKIFAGPRFKRLRREHNLTQARMAADLGVSASYLNLIERNQRPVTAQMLLKLAEAYDVDLRHFAGDEEARALAGLKEVFSDPLFGTEAPGNDDLQAAANASPAVADAVALLYRAYREAVGATALLAERLVDRDAAQGVETRGLPIEAVRDFINGRNNHFAELDETAEALHGRIGLGADDPYAALKAHLKQAHGVAARIMPGELMSGELRRYDRHRQTVFLSEYLEPPARAFQLAYQIAYFEEARTIEGLVEASGLEDEDARRLARVSLANYFAAALMMPYGLFLRAAEATRYDIRLLGCRFGTSFEQVSHRLTTLQRPGARGIPFFLIRVDPAGNISKRFSAAGFHFARFGGTCPRWNVYDAFRLPGQMATQIIRMEDDTRYFTLARTVGRSGSADPFQGDHYAIGLGCDIAHAPKLVYSEGWDLANDRVATPIGVNCRLCERMDCAQRAHPPIKRRLAINERVRGLSPFGTAG